MKKFNLLISTICFIGCADASMDEYPELRDDAIMGLDETEEICPESEYITDGETFTEEEVQAPILNKTEKAVEKIIEKVRQNPDSKRISQTQHDRFSKKIQRELSSLEFKLSYQNEGKKAIYHAIRKALSSASKSENPRAAKHLDPDKTKKDKFLIDTYYSWIMESFLELDPVSTDDEEESES